MKVSGRKILLGGLLCLSAILLAGGCKKSAREIAEQNAIERHQLEVLQRKSILKAIRGPEAPRTFGAIKFLASLDRVGRLPGIPKNADASITLAQTRITPAGRYFSTTEFQLALRTDPPQVYDFTIVQAYSNSDFQLQKVWRGNLSGKILETYPISQAADGANPRVTFLGPVNPGAESGFDHWSKGAIGTGSTAIDHEAPAAGFHAFRVTIAGTAPGQTNHADIRSDSFPLGQPGNPPGPFTFSFAYKLPDKVNAGDNLQVFLRYFGRGDDSFLGQEVYPVGSSTGDSEMTQYKTLTVSNLFAPTGAVKADVWITANIFEPWSSGSGQFDKFSLITVRQRTWGEIFTDFGIAAALVVLLGAVLYLFYRRKPAASV